jgi:hypothetical protein
VKRLRPGATNERLLQPLTLAEQPFARHQRPLIENTFEDGGWRLYTRRMENGSPVATSPTTPEPGLPCRQDLDTLSAFFDNELDPRRRLLVQLHVAGCRRCTMVLCAFGEIRQRLRRIGSRHPWTT